VTASRRSIHPNIPGVPWWAAVVIGVIPTAVGFAFDAGSANKELTDVFSALYVVGCVAAVLAVRRSGIFTAVIQPPLILFCAVPGAYWVFHGARMTGLKDLAINCGYPLIERFPLMLFTSAGVLLIGMIRWYMEMAVRSADAETADSETEPTGGGTRGIVAKLASILGRETAKPTHTRRAGRAAAARARRTEAAGRRGKSAEATGGRPARRSAATRSRRVRPALGDTPERIPDRTRRRRPSKIHDVDPAEPPRRSRVPRDPDLRDPDPHGRPPREVRRDPHTGRSRATTRSSRFDPYEPMESYEPRHRAAPTGATATHHPISRVRYRGAAPTDDAQKRTRSREPRKSTTESWEF
jgi:hypothetical protein